MCFLNKRMARSTSIAKFELWYWLCTTVSHSTHNYCFTVQSISSPNPQNWGTQRTNDKNIRLNAETSLPRYMQTPMVEQHKKSSQSITSTCFVDCGCKKELLSILIFSNLTDRSPYCFWILSKIQFLLRSSARFAVYIDGTMKEMNSVTVCWTLACKQNSVEMESLYKKLSILI